MDRSKPNLGYSPHELAKSASMSLSFLYKMWREGRGPRYSKVGKRRIIPHDWAQEWLESMEESE
jgi:hypothetical protein